MYVKGFMKRSAFSKSAALPRLIARVIQIWYIVNPVPLVPGFTLLWPYSLDSLKTGIDFLRESGPATVIDTQPTT